MDIPRDPQNRSVDRGPRRDDDLHLDRVVSSQPEIGPTPPDGGYGWLIVVSAVIYHITVPSIMIMYGFVVLKSIRDEDHEEGEPLRVWDVTVTLVPVLIVVIRLLLESWCRVVVKMFNMPRVMALSGLCLTVAGVLLSSYGTSADTNNHIVNLFAGLFAGAGCALTGQQTEVIITHYFREKLADVQRMIRMAPSIGHCLIPIVVGLLCSNYTADIVVMIYAAILMQNCIFLAAYTRPIYIERVIRNTYKMLRDAVEDEDEVIFSNQNGSRSGMTTGNVPESRSADREVHTNPNAVDDGDDHIVVFKSRNDAKEIFDPAVNFREESASRANRFSSDFATIYNDERTNENRFSTDFSTMEVRGPADRYQELESIDRITQPQPLYRETTVMAPTQNNLNFVIDPNMTPGSIRRTASLKKNFFTVMNMLRDINFYLYMFMHLSITFAGLVFGVLFPVVIWEENPNMNVWKVSTMLAIANAAAFCLVTLCVLMPAALHKSRLCALFCFLGALGFYGITLSSNRTFLVVWGCLSSFSTGASNILQQPLYNNVLSEFDTTATITTANTFVAVFVMIWAISFSYQFKTCFFISCIILAFTGLLFLASSFRRLRR